MARTFNKIFICVLAVWLIILVNLCDGKPCDIVRVADGVAYEGEVINDKLLRPFSMTIDYATNTLFLSYTIANIYDSKMTSRYIDLKTKAFGDIGGVNGGFAHAVDSKNHIVYIGGQDGIYQFDYSTKNGTKISTQRLNVWNMFYKDILYFTFLKGHGHFDLYTFENGEAKMVEQLKDTMATVVAVDNNNNIIISNFTGLYKFDKDFKEGKFLGRYAVNSLTSDVNGEIYFSTPASLYKIEADGIKHLFKYKYLPVHGMVVEADGSIIYSGKREVYRLKPTKTNCTGNY